MKNPFTALKRWIDAWAMRRVVRVAVFGHGPSALEWEGLQTTPYTKLVPRLQLVHSVREAHVLALQGPFTKMNWPELTAWVGEAAPTARIIFVGTDAEIVGDRLRAPSGELSPFQVSAQLPGVAPTPLELQAALRCVLEVPHV